MRHRPRTALVAAAVLLVACGCAPVDSTAGRAPVATTVDPSASQTPSGREGQSSHSATPQPPGTTISAAPSEFGEILWGPDEQVVYIWESDVSPESQCYGDCAEAWPPVVTDGEPTADGLVDATLLGTTARSDGTLQVTYGGHPLYFYAHEGPGEVRCHNVATHGGLWWVITPAGERAP